MKWIVKHYTKRADIVRDSISELRSIENMRKEFTEVIIGEDTNDDIIPSIINLSECFYDTSRQLKQIKNNYFEIVVDLGIKFINYGDASGGSFGSTDYRSFLIKDKTENFQIVNIGFQATVKTVNNKYKNELS